MSVVSLGVTIIAYEKLGHCHVKTAARVALNFFGGQTLNSSSSPFLILSFQKWNYFRVGIASVTECLLGSEVQHMTEAHPNVEYIIYILWQWII